MKHYWSISSELVMIDGTAMKDRRRTVPFILQKQIMDSYIVAILALKR